MVVHSAAAFSPWPAAAASSAAFSPPPLFLLLIFFFTASLLLAELLRRRRSSLYLIDYACSRLPDDASTTVEVLFYFIKGLGTLSDADIRFQTKVFLKSGVGEEACVPRDNLEYGRHLPFRSLLDQSEALVIGAVRLLLAKTRVDPSSIDVVIVNCGTFNPTPSLASLVVNRFHLRSDVKTYHLAGMGCSASMISIQLARSILQKARRRSLALVACAEVLHQLYDGKDRSMMVTNCLFRSSGSAFLLSNRAEAEAAGSGGGAAVRAKMRLEHLVRANMAANDEAHGAVEMKEDEEGLVGAKLSTELIKVAGKAIKENLTELAPKVLPVTEMLRAAACWVKGKEFVPKMGKAFQNICIHPGSKAVVEGVAKSLGLNDKEAEASLMALHRFGNTSCAGVWYELAYWEAKKKLKAGNKVWQLGLGSGFKCNSAVWTILRNLPDSDGDDGFFLLPDNPWHDCIHRYPVTHHLISLAHVLDTLQLIDPALSSRSPAPTTTTS